MHLLDVYILIVPTQINWPDPGFMSGLSVTVQAKKHYGH